MLGANKYTTLMASLPYAGQLFTAKQTPISRIQLESRLQMLEREDALLLRKIENLLQWRQHPLARSDAEIVFLAKKFLSTLKDELLHDIVLWRMELRTLVAALRRRKLGQDAPRDLRDWGMGRWVQPIQRFWTEPAFRLEGVFPWVFEAYRLLNDQDTVGFERLLLGVEWDQLGRDGEGHYFDFTAVVIYVLRWNLIACWTGCEGETAVKRFHSLADSGLGSYAGLFA